MTNDSPYRPVLQQTLSHALAYLDGLETASVAPTAHAWPNCARDLHAR